MFIFFCKNCNKFEAFKSKAGGFKCPDCGQEYLSLGVTVDEWNNFSNDEMLDVIEKAKNPVTIKTPVFEAPVEKTFDIDEDDEFEEIDYAEPPRKKKEHRGKTKPARNISKGDKPPRSILWMIISIIAIIASIGSLYLENPTIIAIVATVCLILGVVALIMRAKLRGFAIAAIVSSSLVILLCILYGVFGLMNANKPDQKVKIADCEFTIPGYYKSEDSGYDGGQVYVVENGKNGAILIFLSMPVYNDGGATSSLLNDNKSFVEGKMDEINSMLDEPLEECILGGLRNMNGENIQFVSDCKIADMKAKKYSFTVKNDEIGEAKGLCVGSLDLYSGNVYCVLLAETTGSNKNYIGEFDRIITSANLRGQGSSVNSSSNTGNSDNSSKLATGGVDPNLKAALDEYEAFIDEYIAFMKKYSSDPGNAISMLADYTDMLTRLANFADKINGMDTNSMSAADYAYYMEVVTRVEKKMLTVAQ